MQRLLSTSEQFDFLRRHPVEAARVLETKTFLEFNAYDQILTPPAWYQFDLNIGLIPPVGDEVLDDTFGRVIIFPAPNGKIFFNADVPATLDTTINSPQYPGSAGAPAGGPPPDPADPLQDLYSGLRNVVLLLGLAWLGLTMIEKKL